MKVNILGLGETLRFYKRNKNEITIGVNEVGSITPCDYVCVINNRVEFTPPRYRKLLQPLNQPKLVTHKQSILNDLAGYYDVTNAIYQIENLINSKGNIKQNDGIRGDKFFHSQTSPFVAAVFAVRNLNPTVLSFWGVDFQTHKAIAKNANSRFNREMVAWEWLIKECIKLGIEIEVSEYSQISKIIDRLNITSHEDI